MYQLVIAPLVKMQIELAPHLKRQMVKKTLSVEQDVKELILTLITPLITPSNKQNCQNTVHVSQTEEGVSNL